MTPFFLCRESRFDTFFSLVEDLTNENSLILKIRNTTDQIRIRLFFAYDSLLRKIETLQFSDGTTMSLVGSLSINGSKIAGEALKGSSSSDNITGNIGNDQIYSGDGNDVVAGGKGNDYLEAGFGLGDNSYIFNLGDGQDEIRDYLGSDRIIFGAGISSNDITLIPTMANSESLVIKIGNDGDQITIISFFQFQHNVSKIETLQFADGSIINLANGLTLQGYNLSGEKLTGTDYDDVITGNIGNDEIRGGNGNDVMGGGDGNDIIYANGGDDIITGGKGNDYSENYQETGNDTYIFNLGDGQDVIFDEWGNDRIIFGAGISQGDILLTHDDSIENSLIIKVGTGGDQIKIRFFFWREDTQRKIETLQFAAYCNDNEKNETQGRNISLL